MEFDKSRVYTSVNAEEVKIGSKIICANTKQKLMNMVEFGATGDITELRNVLPDCYTNRFQAFFNEDLINYNLCYLIEEPTGPKLKWTDLKIGDVIKKENITYMVTGIDELKGPGNKHILTSFTWLSDTELEQWEKVDSELEEYERQVTE